jgi:hypothetical protein
MSSQETCSKLNINSFGDKRQAKLRPLQKTIFKKSFRDIESSLAASLGYDLLTSKADERAATSHKVEEPGREEGTA